MKKKIEGTGKWLIKRWGVVSKEMKKDIERVEREAERRGRMNTCNKIKEYVESESGKSGRKEILKYIKLLEEEK